MSDGANELLTNLFNEFCEDISTPAQSISTLSHQQKKLQIPFIYNKTGCNFLIFSVKKNCRFILNDLLDYGFDIDHQDDDGYNAIDHAWMNLVKNVDESENKENSEEIIKILLNANSKFPSKSVGFSVDKAPDSIKVIIDNNEALHKLIGSNDIKQLGQLLETQQHLRYFYDRDNQSLLFYVLKRKKYECSKEISAQLSIGHHESLNEVYYTYSSMSKREYVHTNQKMPKPHLLVLKSKSQILGTPHQNYQNWKCIDEAYQVLDEFRTCYKILRILALNKKLQILFDFENNAENNQKIDNKGEIIYISGAQNLLDVNQKTKFIGTIIHEFSLAVFSMLHLQKFCDYEANIEDEESDHEQTELEEVVRSAFCLNNKNSFNYFSKPNFGELLYCLKVLNSSDQTIKYENLISSMKSKVIHTNISFQGVGTTFHDIVGERTEILNLMSSNQIKNILLENQMIRIGQKWNEKLSKYFIDRQFIENGNIKNVNKLIADRNECNILILADNVGTGKTTAFKMLAAKFKDYLNTFWINYIDLNENADIIEQIIKKEDEITKNNVAQIILRIINVESKLENEIFKKLFLESRVVFLFDEIDKTKSNVADFIINVIEMINQYWQNQIWISMCPEYLEKLKNRINLKKVYKLSPLVKTDQLNLACELFNEANHSLDLIIPEQLLSFLNTLENRGNNCVLLLNPLLIKQIVEQLSENKNNFAKDSLNLYEIFERIYKKHFFIEDLQNETNPIGVFTLTKYHQVHALELLFGDVNFNLDIKLKDFAITKNWKREKQHWTLERSEKNNFLFNILTINQQNGNMIDFIHISFAEFFAVQFITSFLFSNDHYIREQEFENIFQLLHSVAKSSNNNQVIVKFFQSFVMNCSNKKLHKDMKKVLSIKTKSIAQEFDNSDIGYILFWIGLLYHERDTLSDLISLIKDKSLSDIIKRGMTSGNLESIQHSLENRLQNLKIDVIQQTSSEQSCNKSSTSLKNETSLSEENEANTKIMLDRKTNEDPENLPCIDNDSSLNRFLFKNLFNQAPSILRDQQDMKIDERFIVKISKYSKIISDEEKRRAKLLYLSSNWTFEETLTVIDNLNLEQYPNLIVFIIETTNFEFIEKNYESCNIIVEKCSSLLKSRSMILQVTSKDENLSKFYYKEENSNQFKNISMQFVKNYEDKVAFAIFSSFLNDEIDCEDKLRTKWKQIINCQIALEFSKLYTNFYDTLILEISKHGTKGDLVKILIGSSKYDGRILNYEAQNYILKVFCKTLRSKNTRMIKSINKSQKFGDSDEEDLESLFEEKTSTILLSAIEHKNIDVIDYLITYWTHLIQELPVDHQFEISTAAFKTDQLDVLCDLLDIADFPFPEDFEFDDEQEHRRLRKIIQERTAFMNAIKKENFEKIDKFIDDNRNLKCVYSIDNGIALTQAVEFKKFGVFYYLKSLGFQGEDCEDVLNKLDKEDRMKATQQAVKQRKADVNQALVNVHKSVMLLATRSLIHNRRISKEQEAEYRQKIINWLQDIHKVAPEMIDVAASCEYLKIIFDFESDTVENASLAGPNSLGLAYSVSKWIFVGAELSDKKREQQIKGVLAHELCHYVMRLVYENQENPYYKDRKNMKETFEGIVKAIDIWSTEEEEAEHQDDECNGTISSVFTLYKIKEFHLELIVRVVQILTEFDDDKEKTRHLQEKYQNLFIFWYTQVVPDLIMHHQKVNSVIDLNAALGLLFNIKNKNIQLHSSKVTSILDSRITIVTTNVPKLLFADIYNFLQKKYGYLIDTYNVFCEPFILYNQQVFDDFQEVCKFAEKLNIFVDCTNGVTDDTTNIIMKHELNYIFVVLNEQNCEKLTKNIVREIHTEGYTKININYNWNDVVAESQEMLLKNKISFQNILKYSFNDLFSRDNQEKINTCPKLDIDDQILNAMMEVAKISVNSKQQLDRNEQAFEFLFKPRRFLKKKTILHWRIFQNIYDISQEELLSEVKNQTYVLISDMAGNGKSWAMKNFTKILTTENPTSWMSYVDLKEFIDEFKAQEGQEVMPEFSTFLAEKMLRTEHKFELKIFQKLYKDGKVFILFDGFDEIAPNYAEFVSNLAQSFQSNGGNQLWIATHDYFEVDLKKKLKLNVAYGLVNMSDENGVDLIAKSWILMDLNKAIKTNNKFNYHVQESPNLKKYKKKAEQIVKKVKMDSDRSVGMPQMFKMIADGFKDEHDIDNLTRSNIYKKFIKNLYRRWADEKGSIRKEAFIDSQVFECSFWKFYLYQAILSLFPVLAKILFPIHNGKEWPVEEVIACGILSIINGKYYFIHEALREYFAAEALVKPLKSEEINDKIIEVFVDVLTLKQYIIVRMFLNDFIDSAILINIRPKMKKFIKKFNKMESFDDFFTQNLEKLIDIVLSTLKECDYKHVKYILERNSKDITMNTKNSKIFFKFQDFLCQVLTANDLRNLIEGQKIFQAIIEGELKIEVFGDFVLKIEGKTGHEFVQKELKKVINEGWIHKSKFALFFDKTDSSNFKFQLFIIILQKYFTPVKIIEFLKTTDDDDENILSVCIQQEREDILKILWMEMENYFKSQNLSQNFNELVLQDKFMSNNLHIISAFHNIKFHKTFWELLLNTIQNRDQLKAYILQKDENAINFIQKLVRYNKNAEILEWTCYMLKEIFLEDFLKVFRDDDDYGKNTIIYAALELPTEVFNLFMKELKENYSNEEVKKMLCYSDNINRNILHYGAGNPFKYVFQAVWEALYAYLKTVEILELIEQVDKNGHNFLFYIKQSKNFECAIENLESIASYDKIYDLLSSLDIYKRSILQHFILKEGELNFHETVWKIFKKFFEASKLLIFVESTDYSGNNLLHNAVSGIATIEVLEFTWSQIKCLMNHHEQIEYLEIKGNDDKNLIELSNVFNEDAIEWVENIIDEYGLEMGN